MRILVFARAPWPGVAKTRLIPRLGAEGAARLQARLIGSSVRRALDCGLGAVELWCAPDPRHPVFARCAADRQVTLHAQPPGTLGDRMGFAAQRCITAGDACLLIGTDAPSLSRDRILEAARALRTLDATIVPAEDGGYVLLGLRRYSGRIFEDVAWGTDTVLHETSRRLDALGWQWRTLAACWDVDRPEDVDRLAESFPELCAQAHLV